MIELQLAPPHRRARSIGPGLLVLTGLVAISTPVFAQPARPELRVPQVDAAPVIDGRLDDPTWAGAAVLDQWVQTLPSDNGRPHGRTVAYLAYDRTAFYLAVVATDEPGKVRARLHERDNITRQAQDWIGINLDPTNARRRAFSFAVNPIGIQGDGLNIEGTGFEEWDGIYSAAGIATDSSYVIEVAVPFKSIRYPKAAEQRWGFALTRTYGRDGATDSPWPRSRDLACDLCQMITLTGLTDLPGSAAIEINPTVVGRAVQARADLDQPYDGTATSGEVGVNLKYGITPNLTLDGTWNPDFSQVEADASQLEINNRFALFFPERRPFFLEGTDIFLTRFSMPGLDPDFFTPPVNVFYSRRIADPDLGVKLTGKTGRLSVGLLAASDAAQEYAFEDPVGGLSTAALNPFVGRNAQAGIARLKLDVLADGYLGAALTGRRFGDGYGLTATVDSRFRFGRNTTLRLFATSTRAREPDVRGPLRARLRARLPDSVALAGALDSLPGSAVDLDGETFTGTAVQTALEYAGRHWSAGFGALDITPGFRTPLGFTPRTDYALLTGFLNYRWQSIGFFRQVAARLRFEDAYDHQPGGGIGRYHQHTDRVVSSYLDFTLPAATSFSFGYTRLFLRVDGTEFSGLDRGFLFLGSEAWRWFGWNLFLRAGDEVIYTDLVDDGPAQPSSFVNLSLATSTRPIAPLRLELNLTTSTIWRRTVARARDTRYAQSAIPRLRVQAQISRALGLRLIGEYRFEQFFRRDGALDSQRKVLGADILATYLVHPGQSLQLGWSLRAAGNLELPLRNVARGGVVKVAYLWRL